MTKAVQFDTKNQSLRQIMGNGLKYEVPRFQRDYSWDEEQWDELWQDIDNRFPQEQHYMGYIVLQSTDNKNFIIIDGQQRLATVSIIILATLYELLSLIKNDQEKDSNQKRLETIKNNFIGFTNPVTLVLQNKLVLNRNNNSYFSTYLCELAPPAERNINQSNHLIRKALSWFRKKIHGKNGKQLAQLVEDISDLLLFTTITVTEESNAYSIFETLNARGVKLSTPDLVKNYIFSVIDKNNCLHDNDIKSLDEQWGNIIEQLGRHKFSDFIRADWNSRNDPTRDKALFKKIKANITNNDEAKKYLRLLQESSQVYSALRDENDELWKNHKDGIYNSYTLILYLKTLRLFNVVSPLNALLAAFRKFPPRDFIQFLSFIETISVRYNFICNKPTNEQNRVYSQVAIFITNNDNATPKKTLSILRKIYPSDEEFLVSFANKSLKTSQSEKKARYLLYRIEKHLSSHSIGDLENLTLEHILPKSYSPRWEKHFEETEKMASLAERIGNMTLLDQKQNKVLGNKGFDEKKSLFEKSSFNITKKCTEFTHWNEQSISDRQKWLGKQAQSLWHISSL